VRMLGATSRRRLGVSSDEYASCEKAFLRRVITTCLPGLLLCLFGCAGENTHSEEAVLHAPQTVTSAKSIQPPQIPDDQPKPTPPAPAKDNAGHPDQDPEALIAQLGADDFRTREAAEKALMGIGESALPLLREHEDTDDPEVRVRVRRIVDYLAGWAKWRNVALSERMRVAVSVKTSKRTLRELSRDKNPHVRWRVARNGNTPSDVLQRLLKDPDEDVREQARINLDTQGALHIQEEPQ